MSDAWEYFPCTMGEDRAFIFVDVGVAETIKQAPPSLAKVRLAYRDPHENGLPKNEEFEAARAIEARLEEFVAKRSAWYVGRVTVAGHRYFYVYTSPDEAPWPEFVGRLAGETGYDLKCSFRDDPEHKAYWSDLYPTDDDWRVIKDLRVIEQLQEQGDDGTEPRQIDHWAYFDNEAAAQPFVAWAQGDRFTHDAAHSGLTDDRKKYCVRLWHHGAVDIAGISSHTIALRRKALEHGGDYDGWETQVLERK
jgi:hypothetical protein